MLNARIGFWAALLVAIFVPLTVYGQQQEPPAIIIQLPSQGQIPEHVQECASLATVASAFITYRRAGILLGDARNTVHISFRIVRFKLSEPGAPAPNRPVDEVERETLALLEEVYGLDAETLEAPARQEWLRQRMSQCTRERAPKPDNRLIPKDA